MLLDLDALIDALASTMAEVSSGGVSQPQRIAALVREREGNLLAMPAYLPGSQGACGQAGQCVSP